MEGSLTVAGARALELGVSWAGLGWAGIRMAGVLSQAPGWVTLEGRLGGFGPIGP